MGRYSVIAVSICLNLALAGLYLKSKSAAPAASASSSSLNTPTSARSSAKIVRLDWRSVESGDYKDYVKNLRAVGCPEETIYDIIVADVNTLYARRARSFWATNEWRYWDAADALPSREEIRNQKLRRELEKEKQALMREILGADAVEKFRKYQLWGDEDLAERKLAFLSDEKRSKLKLLQEKFFDLRNDTAEWDSAGLMTEETTMKLAALEKQERAEIEALFSKSELEEYDLRTSETADRLRGELNGFHPTEQEFRQLYSLRKEMETVMHASADVRDPTVLEKRVETIQQLERQGQQSLGEERYAEFQRSQNLDYQNVLRLVNYFSLPENAAASVYELKRQSDVEAQKVIADENLPSEQREMAFERMRIETEAALVKLLGARAFEEYQRNNRWWMRNQ